MVAYLLISIPHCCTIQIVGPFQNGILSELLLETKHRIQQLFLFFQLSGVREQVNLEEAFAFDHTVDGYCDPSHGQCFISYSLESAQLWQRSGYFRGWSDYSVSYWP